MIAFDIDEIIGAMREKTEEITYYLDKENEEIVHIDENVAQEVEDEYEEEDTVLEEWNHDVEDDDMYHENIFSSNTEDVGEKELIKKILFTHQDDYEPIPVLTLKDFKKITTKFLKENKYTKNIIENIQYSTQNATKEIEITDAIIKATGDKQAFDKFYEEEIRDMVTNWLKSLGYSI